MKHFALLLVITTLLVGCGQKDPYQRKEFPPIPNEQESPSNEATQRQQPVFVNPELEEARFENPELFEFDGNIKPPLIQMKDRHPELFE